MGNKTINKFYGPVNQYFYDNEKLNSIISQLNTVIMNDQELIAKLTAMGLVVDKIKLESTGSLQLITDLRAALANQGTISPAVEAVVTALEAKLKSVDDLVADQEPAETPPGEGTGTVDPGANQ